MALEEMAAVPDVDPAVVASADPDTEPVDAVEPVEDTPETEVAAEVEEITGDGRVIPQAFREIFKEHKDLKTMFFANKAFQDHFPGGPKEAAAKLAELAEFGGREGYEAVKAEAAHLKEIDELLLAGDAKILDKISAQAPDAIAKLAPQVMAKWYETDPDGCNKTLCGVIANTFKSGGIDNTLNSIRYALKYNDVAEATSLLEGLQKWSGSFEAQAQAPLAAKKAPEVDSRIKELDQREQQMWEKDLFKQADDYKSPTIQKELAPFLKDRNVSDEDKTFITNAISNELMQMLGSDAIYQKSLKSFMERKDADGALKLFKSTVGRIAPGLVAKRARVMVSSPVSKPKPSTPVVRQSPVKPDPFEDPRKALFREIANR